VPPSAERQRQFAAALLDPALPTPAGLVDPDGDACPRRFSVYRNNVVVGLSRALEESFPVVRRLVGPEFFRAMANAYVRADPPRSPILLDYGAGFPSFVASFEPAAAIAYLADVARIERAWIEAYHAAEAQPLGSGAFAEIPADRLADLRLHLHPSIRVVRSPTPALTIWRMNLDGGLQGPVEVEAGGEDAFFVRPESEVEVRSMPPGGADFVLALSQGRSVTEAMEIAFAAERGFDPALNLAGLIDSGAFVGYGLATNRDGAGS
jgi:hypothetical protein